jgi:hypothetical protein
VDESVVADADGDLSINLDDEYGEEVDNMARSCS